MINTIIFDLGGVLIDWNPYHLYRKVFNNDDEIRDFLASVCTPDWNEEQDAGRSLKNGTDILVAKHPDHEDNIRLFYNRWEEMLGGAIDETVTIFKQLKDSGKYKIYALTNWSEETFVLTKARYEFLSWFDGIVVSGTEKIRKPYPEFYKILLDRYHVNPEEALFIDDSARNVEGAENLGISSIHFTSAAELKNELISRGIL
ncbi:HAD-IA family hydrolase [Mucilaginibacter gynuensis]|uniref:HAD-IA family hydrolase n=1 Tax=Mucilaginibacter gynuensis TaxID=1302236 RepID=A0ABP8H8Y3_9SPHI